MKNIRGAYQEAELPELGEGEQIDTSIPADPNVKNYSYTVVDGEVYYRENSRMVKPELNATAAERVKGMVALRDCVNELIALQMDEYSAESRIQEAQTELNRLYDAFSAKHGLINDRANLPELMNLFKEVADIKTADQLHLPTPEVAYHTIATKPTQIQQDMVKALSERASKVHSGAVSPDVDNIHLSDHDLKIPGSLLRGRGRYGAVLCGDQGAVCR